MNSQSFASLHYLAMCLLVALFAASDASPWCSVDSTRGESLHTDNAPDRPAGLFLDRFDPCSGCLSLFVVANACELSSEELAIPSRRIATTRHQERTRPDERETLGMAALVDIRLPRSQQPSRHSPPTLGSIRIQV